MSTQARLDAVGIVVADMAKALAFYRKLGLEVPASADGEPHVEVGLPGGLRVLFDTEEVIRSFHPGWVPVRGGRTNLAFALPDAAGVDALHAELVAARRRRAIHTISRILPAARAPDRRRSWPRAWFH